MKVLNEKNGNDTAKKLLGLEEYCRDNGIVIDHGYAGLTFRVNKQEFSIIDLEDGQENQEFPRVMDSEVFRLSE